MECVNEVLNIPLWAKRYVLSVVWGLGKLQSTNTYYICFYQPPSSIALVPRPPDSFSSLLICVWESLGVRLIPLSDEMLVDLTLFCRPFRSPVCVHCYTRRGQRGSTLNPSSSGRCEVVAHTTSQHYPGEAQLLPVPSLFYVQLHL